MLLIVCAGALQVAAVAEMDAVVPVASDDVDDVQWVKLDNMAKIESEFKEPGLRGGWGRGRGGGAG